MAQEYYGGTPISGTYTPEAENVNLDSIAGMTSTNVQDGIEELKTSVDSKASSSHTHTKSEITDMFSVVNDLTTGGSTNALSAEMGKQLNSNLTQFQLSDLYGTETQFYKNGNDIRLINIYYSNEAKTNYLRVDSNFQNKNIMYRYFENNSLVASFTIQGS